MSDEVERFVVDLRKREERGMLVLRLVVLAIVSAIVLLIAGVLVTMAQDCMGVMVKDIWGVPRCVETR